MSNYYEYEDVKIAMYHALQKKEGWKLYGYKPDESDLMTDYYSPARWDGIGVKNGFVLCVKVYGAEKERIIKRYTETQTNNEEINQKIKKLSQMTVERGASEAEAETALKMIETLKTKIGENIENYEVAEIIPSHQANPSRCNWHIEKDGVIIEKGSGILKFSSIYKYFMYPAYKEQIEIIEKYENKKDTWISLEIDKLKNSNWNMGEKEIKEIAEKNFDKMLDDLKLYRQFQALINKIDCACGSTIGEGYTYEKKIVTEYKTENKVFIDETGEKKQGQCFVLNTNFNYGCCKGFVYQIQEIKYNDGKIGYCAYKMNGKLTKICTGSATRSNYWYIGSGEHDNLSRHLKNGNISWCHIEEVRTPYEVEKLVKVDTKNRKSPEQPQTEEKETFGNYTVEKSKHTKTGETIYLVKPIEKLSEEKYQDAKKKMIENGGYYSKFVHGFIFKKFPSFLNTAAKKEKKEQKEEFAKIEKPSFESFKPFEVPETNEQTNKQNKNKPDFETYQNIDFSQFEKLNPKQIKKETKKPCFEVTEENKRFYVRLKQTVENLQNIKRRLAEIGGFYSSNKDCFIFSDNPRDKLLNIII